MVTNPAASPETDAATTWLEGLTQRGTEIVVPEIADYEVRRELLRAGKHRDLRGSMPSKRTSDTYR